MGSVISGVFGNIKLAFFLAFKSIYRGNRWAALLIVAVMALSFANLILTPSILSGVTASLNAQQINTLYGNLVIDPNQNAFYLDHVSQIVRKLDQYPGVTGVSAHLTSSALIEYKWKTKTDASDKGISGHWNVIGIDPARESLVTTISRSMLAGSYLAPDDRDKIVLGVEITGGTDASSPSFLNLGGVEVGDKVRLTYSNGSQREYTVKGIFKAREGQADSQAFVSQEEMVSVLGPSVFSDRASQIIIKANVTASDQSFITGLQGLGIDGQIRDWSQYASGMGSVAGSFGVVASLIGGIGLVVAAIVMFIVIYISVVNKKRQIGILRAIGINRAAIYLSYLSQALFYAIAGIVLGALLFANIIVPYFNAHPITLSIGLVTVAIDTTSVRNAVIGILLAAVMAGIIPVINITRHSIIKAIWGN